MTIHSIVNTNNNGFSFYTKMSLENTIMHVEIARKSSLMTDQELEELVKRYISSIPETEIKHNVLLRNLPAPLTNLVDSISFSHDWKNHGSYNVINAQYHVYKLANCGHALETLDGDENEEVTASNHWILPSYDFYGLWESLYFEKDIKDNLLKFIETAILFSEKQIDQNIISANRLVLLHGPPGTGKTSLCKALSQKIAIRMKANYRFFHLIEVNSHSLFSKWFSESGKLVMKLFSKIHEIIETKSSFVCVLIDEIESIAFARTNISNNEPSDSIRVVNAVLTQLDQIRKHSNVLILSTSNLTSTIDLAFIDRADVKQYIGEPNEEAIFNIYQSAIDELIRVGIILPLHHECIYSYSSLNGIDSDTLELSKQLLLLSQLSCGLSGRTLRKIPFLAHALHLYTPTANLHNFLKAMELAVKKYSEDNKNCNL